MYKRFFSVLVVASLLIIGVAAHAQDTVSITVRCKSSPPTEDWRCNNFAEVEEEVEAELGIDIELNLIQDNKGWGDYKNEFVLASDAGEAPDIILSGHEDVGVWSANGLIIPLAASAEEIAAQDEHFADIVPSLWNSTIGVDGQIYGIPQDTEARPLFYSKPLLRDLGWTEEEIESLPDRILAGEFTFEDMIATAQQAVDEGIVDEGNGFWHRPSSGFDFLYYYYGMGGDILDENGNLIFDTDAALRVYETLGGMADSGVLRRDMIGTDWDNEWHPTVSGAEDVLFWAGGTWNWGQWAAVFQADRGGNDFLLENIGAALIPAMDTGQPITLTHPLVYMISSQSEHPDVALALLSAISTPEANNRHAIDSFHLGILNEQINSEGYADSQLGAWHYMLNNTTFAPNHPDIDAYIGGYFLGIQAVENGDLDPQGALDAAIAQLENELGDAVVIQ